MSPVGTVAVSGNPWIPKSEFRTWPPHSQGMHRDAPERNTLHGPKGCAPAGAPPVRARREVLFLSWTLRLEHARLELAQ